jgi:glycosyltransferase involved in cell wall biosynthesis
VPVLPHFLDPDNVRVCFVALNAYPAIDPAVGGPIGGIETRSWMLARALARMPGVQMQFVVRHHEALQKTVYDEVQLVPLIDPLYPHWQTVGHALTRRPGFPWIRIKQWSPKLLWLLPRLAFDRLRRGRVYAADTPDSRLVAPRPDVYATFGVQTHSAVVIRSARQAQRPCVLFLGSDGDLDPLFEPGRHGVDPYGTPAEVGRFILSAADHIIAQTPEQQHRLRSVFGRDSRQLLTPIDADEWRRLRSNSLDLRDTDGLDRYVLWIGRAEDLHKRPQLCLDIATLAPEVPFLMVLNRRDPAVEHRIRRDAPPNVHIIERIPFPHMPALFARASAFLSTSRLEGFPNVFLQAAISGVPIVSLGVGGEFLAHSRAGVCTPDDFPGAAELLRRCHRGEPSSQYDADAARDYVLEHHALDTQVTRLHHWLQAVAANRPSVD